MAVRVGRWDCSACGHIGNYGPNTKCSSCGSPRPSDVKFYLPKDAEIVTDAERLKEARAGVDWICGHCSSQNKAIDKTCNSCGNPRDETSQDVNLQEREYDSNEVPEDGTRERKVIHPLEKQKFAPKGSSNSSVKKLLMGIGAIGAIFLLLRIFPVSTTVTVDSFRWERTLQMLHYEAVKEEGWSLPNGAFNSSSSQEIREYEQVFRGYETRTRTVQVPVGTETYECGQVDKGNGYFETKYCTRTIYESRQETYEEAVYDQVPIYDTYYRYSIMKWVAHDKNLLKSAASDHEAKWPVPVGREDPEEWRQGTKKGTYYVMVKESDGDIHQEQVGPKYWENLNTGQKLKAEKMFLFGVYFGLAEPQKDS